MRYKKRETSQEEAWLIFDDSFYATLAMSDKDGYPYATALSMARVGQTIYFHCAIAGRKWELLKANSNVCVHAVAKAKSSAQHFTMYYDSCTIFGKAILITNKAEKNQALLAICQKYCSEELMQSYDSYVSSAIDCTGVFKIEVQDISGKRNQEAAH